MREAAKIIKWRYEKSDSTENKISSEESEDITLKTTNMKTLLIRTKIVVLRTQNIKFDEWWYFLQVFSFFRKPILKLNFTYNNCMIISYFV